MRWTPLAAAGLLVSTAAAKRSMAHVGKSAKNDLIKRATPVQRHKPHGYGGGHNNTIIPQNANTTRFAVNGSALPDVDFDIGESYAGLLDIGPTFGKDPSELYFWFFPSANELAGDEIIIWLNGGPGCSSLEG